MSGRKNILWLFLCLAILLVGGLFVSRGQAVSDPTVGLVQSTPTAPGQEGKFIEDLDSALQNDRLDEASRKSLEEKRSLNQRLEAQRQPAATPAGPKGPAGPPNAEDRQLLVEPAQAVEDEIIEGSEGLVRTWEASIQNLWQGQRNGRYYQVLAGSAPEDAQQGLLIVIEVQADGITRDQQTYLTPVKSGSLRIISVQDMRLELLAGSDSTLYFDLESRDFAE